jgi:tetratricopeptide (TPR) repeat protein
MDRVQRDKARPHFEKAVALDPDFVMAWLALARSQARIKESQDLMVKVYAMIETAEVSAGERLQLESVLAGRDGDRATVEANTIKLAQMYPNDERCQAALGGLYYGRNEYQQAVAAYERGLQANPDFVPIYNILGYTYRNLGDNAKAEMAFQRAIVLDPDNPNGYDSYAELLLKVGRYQDSIETYEKALALDPLFPSAVMGIASNLMHMEEYDEARTRLAAVNDLAPHDGIKSGVCWATAITYVDQGNFDAALEELHRNYELSKNINDVGAMSIDLNNMGFVLMEAGRYTDAATAFEQALELRLQGDRPENIKDQIRAFYLYNQGRLAVAAGNLREAEAISQEFSARVTEVDGGPFMEKAAHELAGIVALAEKKYALALEDLNQADTTSADNMFRIAQAYQGLGDTAAARQWYEYVVTYRGGLNLSYSLVRHQAAEKLAVM